MTHEFEQKADIEKLLAEGNTIQLHPQGYSMYPMFCPGRDEAIISPVQDASELKRGDVVLYRRDGGILVLHRIYKLASGIWLFIRPVRRWITVPGAWIKRLFKHGSK